jgi:hypothetical protein
VKETLPPTKPPTNTPSKSPTNAPITKGPTSGPTQAPTKAITYAPITKAPTDAPSTLPSHAPSNTPTANFVSETDTCATGFVYCPGRSSCFTDLVTVGNETGMWGWSIEYNGGTLDNCEIYTGVGGGCDLQGATKVGTFTISESLVHYCLDLNHYESNAFQFYAGRCMVNDAGTHLGNNETCIAQDEAKYANKWETYPLKSEGGPLVSVFTFDSSDNSSGTSWPSSYQVFPVGNKMRMYLSAHVDVCPVTKVDSFPLSKAPSKAPSKALTYAPIKTPAPTPHRTSNGIAYPTTHGPTKIVKQDTVPQCQPAWVYCPGRSKCLNDPTFNDGTMPALGVNGSVRGVWGWSIAYDPNVDGTVEDCEVWAGAIDCDFNAATKVGVFTIRNDFGHFCLDKYGYAADTFGYYGGQCKGNDAGDSLKTGQCSSSKVASYAASPENFPFYTSGGQMEINFTVENSDAVNSPPWPATTTIFPLKTKSYISAYTCVLPKDVAFPQQGAQVNANTVNVPAPVFATSNGSNTTAAIVWPWNGGK